MPNYYQHYALIAPPSPAHRMGRMDGPGRARAPAHVHAHSRVVRVRMAGAALGGVCMGGGGKERAPAAFRVPGPYWRFGLTRDGGIWLVGPVTPEVLVSVIGERRAIDGPPFGSPVPSRRRVVEARHQPAWSPWPGSNRRPPPSEGGALSTELRGVSGLSSCHLPSYRAVPVPASPRRVARRASPCTVATAPVRAGLRRAAQAPRGVMGHCSTVTPLMASYTAVPMFSYVASLSSGSEVFERNAAPRPA